MSKQKLNRDTGAAVRRLTPGELAELRRDMAEASAWARAELKRRKNAVKSEASNF